MSRWVKRTLIGIAIVMLTVLLGIGGLYLLLPGCKDSKKEVAVSPDGAWKAVSYYRDCGVFADGSAVYVVPVRRWWVRRSDYVFGADGPVYLSMSWTDSTHLRIIHDRGFAPNTVSLVNKQEQIGPIRIAYTELQ
jgi:hypothetical protein